MKAWPAVLSKNEAIAPWVFPKADRRSTCLPGVFGARSRSSVVTAPPQQELGPLALPQKNSYAAPS
jgi:hypothetical protein